MNERKDTSRSEAAAAEASAAPLTTKRQRLGEAAAGSTTSTLEKASEAIATREFWTTSARSFWQDPCVLRGVGLGLAVGGVFGALRYRDVRSGARALERVVLGFAVTSLPTLLLCRRDQFRARDAMVREARQRANPPPS